MKGQGPDPGKLCSALPCRVGNWAVDTHWLLACPLLSASSALCAMGPEFCRVGMSTRVGCPGGLVRVYMYGMMYGCVDVWNDDWGVSVVYCIASESSFLGTGALGASSAAAAASSAAAGELWDWVQRVRGSVHGLLCAACPQPSCELRAASCGQVGPRHLGSRDKTGALD